MLDKVIENNRVSIIGEVVSEFEFSHEVFGEGFYLVNVSVNRLSDMVDIIPLMISERLVDVTKDYRGRKIEVSGQFRSYNRHEGVKINLFYPFCKGSLLKKKKFRKNRQEPIRYSLMAMCKPPVYRKTPLGREIADILVAVNRPYGKSDYIPCIAWGRNARYASTIEVGGHLQIWGRVQSREYTKKISEEQVEKRVAYEVSVSKIDVVEEDEA